MGKVNVSEEQFHALESFRKAEGFANDKDALCNYYIGKAGKFIFNENKSLNSLRVIDLIKCVYIGYQLELSKEDKLYHYFQSLGENEERVLLYALSILEIEIEGINK